MGQKNNKQIYMKSYANFYNMLSIFFG